MMKFDSQLQTLFSDNPFLKGSLCYSELEDGLWVMKSSMDYKNNVAYKPIYDNTLPSDYYCLTINIVENKLTNKFYEFDNFKIENESISFLKPKRDFINCHFKGSSENQYIIYFSKEWAKNNLFSIANFSPQIINLFENDAIGFTNYKYKKETFGQCIQKFQDIFNTNQKPNLFELKKNTFKFFDLFINSIDELQSLGINKLNLKDRIKIQKIESFLLENMYEKFFGLDLLSEAFDISPTKLKSDFKNLYGISIYKYFKSKQMDLALKLMQQQKIKINEVAQMFQYENVSKFSKTFEKKHGFLPSKVNLQ